MTSRERVFCALDHRQPDRCPTYIWMTGRLQAVLEEYLGVEGQDGIEEALQIDRWRRVQLERQPAPDEEEQIRQFIPKRILGREGIRVLDDGRVVREHRKEAYGDDTIWYPLQEVEDLSEIEAYPFPDPDQIKWPDESLREEVETLKTSDTIVQGHVIQPFKGAWQYRGMENLLCDYLLWPELVEALYDRVYGYITGEALVYAEAGVDMVCVIGDIGMQDRLIYSPDLWRKFDKPRFAKFIRTIKEAHPDVMVYMHSDGELTDIVPDLVEIGLDILNPIQPECMDPFTIKKEWGDQLSLVGAVSLQRTMPFGTVDEVQAEVRKLIEVCGENGGYVMGPANGFTIDIPLENIVAMYEAVPDSSE